MLSYKNNIQHALLVATIIVKIMPVFSQCSDNYVEKIVLIGAGPYLLLLFKISVMCRIYFCIITIIYYYRGMKHLSWTGK